MPEYITKNQTGSHHNPIFQVEVKIHNSKFFLVRVIQKEKHNKLLQKTNKFFKDMNWENEGYLLSKIKFRENANIVNVFTKIMGK